MRKIVTNDSMSIEIAPKSFTIDVTAFGQEYYFVLNKPQGGDEVSLVRIDEVVVSFQSKVSIRVFEHTRNRTGGDIKGEIPFLLPVDSLPETPEEAVNQYADNVKSELLEKFNESKT